MVDETYKQQMRDSDMIFKQMTHGDFPTIETAKDALVFLYAPDKTISRSGISHALKKLERYYKEKEETP